MKPFVIDNLLDKNAVSTVYDYLISCPNWSLDRYSLQSSKETFAGMTAYDNMDGQQFVGNHFLYGYFSALIYGARREHERETGLALPQNVKRIHFGAKNNNSFTEFHVDSFDPSDITYLGFIMPSWSPEWGGDIQIAEEKYTCDPGRFIVFPSHLYHNGVSPNQNTPYWRISVNIICGV